MNYASKSVSLIKALIQLFTLIAIASNIGSGYASTYARIIVARCASGIGASVALSIGGATVLYCTLPVELHADRDRYRFVICSSKVNADASSDFMR
jgi:hypothetical protein